MNISKTTKLTLGLIAGATVGNVVGTLIACQVSYDSQTYLYPILYGLLGAQPCLIAIWLALGNQPLICRICSCFGTVFLLTVAYGGALNYGTGRGMPLEIPFILGGTALIVILCVQVPFFIARKLKSTGGMSEASSESEDGTRYGIRHLMILITSIALAIPISQFAFRETKIDGNAPWFSIIIFFSLFVIFACLATLLSVAIVFQPQKRNRILIGLSLLIFIGPPLASAAISRFLWQAGWNMVELVVPNFIFACVVLGSVIPILSIYRKLGIGHEKQTKLDSR
ncbi:MAG: hypothetical protein AAF939_22140 [Planctomycetota bacterium]